MFHSGSSVRDRLIWLELVDPILGRQSSVVSQNTFR
jgi:hypothetical protein